MNTSEKTSTAEKSEGTKRDTLTFIGFMRGMGRMVARGIGSVVFGKEKESHVDNENALKQDNPSVHHYKEIMRLQKDYSECMRLIYAYQREKGERYGEEFVREISSRKEGPTDPSQFDALSAINSCRSTTTNYWREILVFRRAYPQFVHDQELEKSWRFKHGRFVELVEPLNSQDGYSKEEIYSRALFNQS